MLEPLHKFDEVHVEENCENLSGFHENGLFFGCTFKDLRGLTLKDCDLNHAKFLTDDVREALGFTLTISCLSFNNAEYSPLLFDLLCLLMYKTKGNDEKREKLLDIVGRDRAEKLLHILKRLE